MRKWTRTIIAVAAIGTLVAAIAYAVDFYRKATKPPSIDLCIANLKQISAAKDTWALEHLKTTNEVPTWSDLVGPYLRTEPTCYRGGTYTLRPVGQKPTCTVPRHSF